MKNMILIGGLVGILMISGCGGGGPYKEFAQCLTKADVVMYGTDWCGHCTDQKEMFGDDFDYIEFVDCDFHSEECSEAGITGYPTWLIDGEVLGRGSQTFDALAEASGCEAP